MPKNPVDEYLALVSKQFLKAPPPMTAENWHIALSTIAVQHGIICGLRAMQLPETTQDKE